MQAVNKGTDQTAQMQLLFAYCNSRFSHDMAHFIDSSDFKLVCKNKSVSLKSLNTIYFTLMAKKAHRS